MCKIPCERAAILQTVSAKCCPEAVHHWSASSLARWSVEATAIRLLELSAKAKENGERYAILTATRAAESVERQPYRSKPAPRPS